MQIKDVDALAPEPPQAPAQGGSLEAQRPPGLSGPTPTTPALPDLLTGGGATPPPPRQVPAPSAQPTAATAHAHDDIEQYFIGCLVEALGVAPETYMGIAGETFGAALAASEAFKNVQRSNRALDRLIDERERAAQVRVDQMYEQLVGSKEAQSRPASEALDAAYDDVLRNLPIIVLLPGGPVERELKSIRHKLERQFESDLARPTPEEEDLLRLVRRLDDNLARSARQGADDWRRLHVGFMQGPFAILANRAKRPGAV